MDGAFQNPIHEAASKEPLAGLLEQGVIRPLRPLYELKAELPPEAQHTPLRQ
jgi:hypothetical protein